MDGTKRSTTMSRRWETLTMGRGTSLKTINACENEAQRAAAVSLAWGGTSAIVGVFCGSYGDE